MADAERATRIVRSLKGGQITIPSEFRKQLGIQESTLLQVTVEGGELRIRPMRGSETGPGSAWLKELYDLFAPVRTEATQYSEAEVDAAIDAAVKAVRSHRA